MFILYAIAVMFLLAWFWIKLDEDDTCPMCGGQMLDYDYKTSFCEDTKHCQYAVRNGYVVGKWADEDSI